MNESEKGVPEKLLKPYNPAETEGRIYEMWEKSGYFNPDNLPERHKVPFSIVLPPPNATGTLHIGGALMVVIEDTMVRYKRMRGFKTMWLPGTDHAAIATNSKVEKILQKEEGKSRHDIGREAFVAKVEKFVEENRGVIKHQIAKMGASLDWSREAFTLDEQRNLGVRTAFKRMYEANLIYKGWRIVNWDIKGQTTISDDEIVYKEEKTKLYTFKYSKDFPFAIATTRPETKVGDRAVALNPDDPKFKNYKGAKRFRIDNFCGVILEIDIISDNQIDSSFGTGAVGITPVHSHTDWEISERNRVDRTKQVIDELGKMTAEAGDVLAGKKVVEAREIVVQWLRDNGLMIKEEEITHNIATAERTGGIVEPLPKTQWFIDVNFPITERGNRTLRELMQDAVIKDGIKFLPERFGSIYFNWINSLRDWCISRQIWYGHRIPAWYCDKCSPKPHLRNTFEKRRIIVSINKPQECDNCGSKDIYQDPDTLDTWFSAGLWTFSTLGWPDETLDLETYHPTDVLETGYDILFFWVARMILMSQFLLGEVPFKTVYLHGLVRNNKGEKISKSLGGNIDPLDILAKWGTDATRMALIVGVGPGADSKLSDDKLKAYKHFANKLWNIARYVMSQEGEGEVMSEIKKEFDALVTDVTSDMDNYRFYLAAEKIYHYVWHRFADEIIEESKGKPEYAPTLRYILENSLKLLHPFMPFVTEEVWGLLGFHKEGKLLMIETWPT